MKKIFSLTTVLFFIALISSGQIYSTKNMVEFVYSNKLQRGDWKPVYTEKDVAGSPYLNDEFVKGSVYTTSKIRYEGVPLRYNIYSDQIEFKGEKGEVLAIAAPETIEKIEFNGDTWVYAPYSLAKYVSEGYFIVLEEDDVSLYKKPQIQFEPPTEAMPFKDAQPARFENRPDHFYIRVGNKEAKKVADRKDFAEILPAHQKDVEKFVKKEKVKPHKPDRIIELVKFYNSL